MWAIGNVSCLSMVQTPALLCFDTKCLPVFETDHVCGDIEVNGCEVDVVDAVARQVEMSGHSVVLVVVDVVSVAVKAFSECLCC